MTIKVTLELFSIILNKEKVSWLVRVRGTTRFFFKLQNEKREAIVILSGCLLK